jgi:hypothetical protein
VALSLEIARQHGDGLTVVSLPVDVLVPYEDNCDVAFRAGRDFLSLAGGTKFV